MTAQEGVMPGVRVDAPAAGAGERLELKRGDDPVLAGRAEQDARARRVRHLARQAGEGRDRVPRSFG